MKIGVIVFFVIFSSVFVSGELSVYCEKDSDCNLAFDNNGYSCIKSLCEKEGLEKPIIIINTETRNLDWDIISIQEKEQICESEGCISSAPKKENDSLLIRLINFLVYLKG